MTSWVVGPDTNGLASAGLGYDPWITVNGAVSTINPQYLPNDFNSALVDYGNVNNPSADVGSSTQSSAVTIGANGSIGTSALQSDVSVLVGDLFGILQQSGSSTATGSTTTQSAGATVATNGSTGASAMQNDVNNLVTDLFGILQQSGSSTATTLPTSNTDATTAASSTTNTTSSISAQSAAVTTAAILPQTGLGANTSSPTVVTSSSASANNSSFVLTAATSSASTSANDQPTNQTDSNSHGIVENTLMQELLTAIQAYRSSYASSSSQSATIAAIA